MLQELARAFSTFVAIFTIVDPFAVVPVYLTLTDRFAVEAIVRTRRRAALVAMGILSTFAITGLSIFKIFSITLPAFQVAGGILLLLLAIAQLSANRTRIKPEEQSESMSQEDVSVFPIGTPLLAGPGAISTVVLYASEAKTWLQLVLLVVAIGGAMGASYLVLKAAHPLLRVLGKTGLNLLTRIMGLILAAVAVQFIINGIAGALRAMHLIGPVLGGG
jgi:multiple antibiotic resistance protein